jgi:demethylmenaquinone methyltransferase/2-methoxy-6-polyprenyl-1,4-benzoquinol methylase
VPGVRNPGDAALLAEQVAYYRARAGEYDEWWARTGRYDRGEALNAAWHADCAAVESALATFLRERGPRRVLELACGTGLFTRHLAPVAERVVAVDAAPEVIAVNRARTGATHVEYVEADIFAWTSAERFNLVFFSFWLSHVPPARFDAFWEQVRALLAPGGTAYLIDSAFDPTSTAKDHVLTDDGVVARKLNDGRAFRVVKVFHDAAGLNERLAQRGWNASVARTAAYFIHGPAWPA